MTLLDRYLFKEMALPFLYGFLLILLLVFGNIVYSNLYLIVSRINEWYLVVSYLFCKIPSCILMSLPAGAIFGSSIALLRMQRESELVAIKVSGVPNSRIFISLMIFGVVLTLVGYLFQEVIVVKAEKKSQTVLNTLFSIPGDLPIEPNIFVKSGNYCIRVQSIERTDKKIIYKSVILYTMTYETFPTLITAASAIEDNGSWILRNGTSIDFNKDGTPNVIVKFDTLRISLDSKIFSQITSSVKDAKSYSALELKKMIKNNINAGLSAEELELEYASKQAFPLSSLAILFCIVPICLLLPQRASGMGMILGVATFFIYWNIMWFSQILGKTGGLNPYLAGWSIVIIFSLIGCALLCRINR